MREGEILPSHQGTLIFRFGTEKFYFFPPDLNYVTCVQ